MDSFISAPEKRAGVGGGSPLVGAAWQEALVLERAGMELA